MKSLILIPLFFILLNSYSQNCNIGNDTLTNAYSPGNFSPNFILGVKFTLTQTGTLRSLNLMGKKIGERIQMALYDDNLAVPRNLIASSSISTIRNGVTSLPVNPILLPPGDYWIMTIYETGGYSSDVNLGASGSVVYYSSLTFGNPLPSNASNFLSYSGQDFLYFLGVDCGNTLCKNRTIDVQTACNSFTWINGITYTSSNNSAKGYL